MPRFKYTKIFDHSVGAAINSEVWTHASWADAVDDLRYMAVDAKKWILECNEGVTVRLSYVRTAHNRITALLTITGLRTGEQCDRIRLTELSA